MKLRLGLSLTIILSIAMAGCASGGGGGGAPTSIAGSGGALLAQGERIQQTDNTRAAQQALDDADGAENPAQKRQYYEQALSAAQAGITEIPTNPLPHRQAALALLGLERYEEAAVEFDKAGELRPIYALEDAGIRERTWINLYQQAIPLVNNGDYEGAADIFRNAVAIYDQRPEARITLGQIDAQLRRHEEALANFDRAEAIIDSASVDADSATVAGWNEQAAGIPYTRAQVLADAGSVAQSEGRTADATRWFEQAVTAFQGVVSDDPGNVQALKNLAAIQVELGNTDEAFGVYERLMELPDLNSEDLFEIGVGFYQGEDVTRAGQAFALAAERSPKDRDALEMWARSLAEDSAYADVPPVAQRWIALDPNNDQAYAVLARALNENGDVQGAGQAVNKIQALDVVVSNLQLTRFGNGGAQVSGNVTNKTRDEGAPVTIQFTFYDSAGNPMGTVDQSVNLAAQGMGSVFRVEFQSMDQVGGYSYQVTS